MTKTASRATEADARAAGPREITVRVKASNGEFIRGQVVRVPLDERTLARIDSGYLEPTADEADVAPTALVRTGDERPTSATATTRTTTASTTAVKASAGGGGRGRGTADNATDG